MSTTTPPPPQSNTSTFNSPPSENTTPTKSSNDSIHSEGKPRPNHRLELDMTPAQFKQSLYTFMEKRGMPITKVPSLGYQELDLLKLYKLVIKRGGMDVVTRNQEWKSVYQDLEIPTMSTSASYNTRTNYKKYLYLYELEHCDFENNEDGEKRRTEPAFEVNDYIRIVSEVWDGQVFYAKIIKYRYNGEEEQYEYYVHYNGWGASHDEWMPESVLSALTEEEAEDPESLCNPAPSRSSKSNRIISSEKDGISSALASSPKSPASPAKKLSITSAGGQIFRHAKKKSTTTTTSEGESLGFGPISYGHNLANDQVKERISAILQDELTELTHLPVSAVAPVPADCAQIVIREKNLFKPKIRKYQLHTRHMLKHSTEKLLSLKPDITNTISSHLQATVPEKTKSHTPPSRALNLPKDKRSDEQLDQDVKSSENKLSEVKDRLRQCTRRLEKLYGKSAIQEYLKSR